MHGSGNIIPDIEHMFSNFFKQRKVYVELKRIDNRYQIARSANKRCKNCPEKVKRTVDKTTNSHYGKLNKTMNQVYAAKEAKILIEKKPNFILEKLDINK